MTSSKQNPEIPELAWLLNTKEDKKKDSFLFFVAFDVVNSTEIKSHNYISIIEYQKHLKNSFSNITDMLFEKDQGFRLWKFLGDEFIYCVEVAARNSLAEYVGVAYSTLKNINSTSSFLRFKAVSWLAFFDKEENIKVEFEGSDIGIDYIGKHIDLGFRLGKHSTRNRLILSLLVVQFLFQLADDSVEKKIYFMGNRDLKGIWGVDLYPIFWYEDLVKINYDYYEKNDLGFFKNPTDSGNEVANILCDILNNEPWKLPDKFLNAFKNLPDTEGKGKRRPEGREDIRYRNELHVATVIYNIRSDKFLIGKRSNIKTILPDIWEFGGGQIHLEEKISDGARRKAKEEFNIEVDPRDDIVSLYFISEQKINGIKIFCLTDDDKVEIDNSQHQNYRWVSLDELKELNPDECIEKLYDEALTFYNEYKSKK